MFNWWFLLMNKSILNKLYTQDSSQLVQEIFNIHKKQWYCVVNFLYFANIEANKLFDENRKNISYEKALINWDFLLPDGIALQLVYQRTKGHKVPNLNWTDFTPIFLNALSSNTTQIILYWTFDKYLDKAKEYIETKLNKKVIYHQEWYSEFDFNKIQNIDKTKINILLVWRWTPRQEIRVDQNIDTIKSLWLIVMNVWWLFDFWWWMDKRAPLIVRKLKWEWLWRLLLNPKKNFKKVLNSLLFLKYII